MQHENYRPHRNHRREPSRPPELSDSEVHVHKLTSIVFALFRLVYLSKQEFNHNLKKNPMKGKKSKIREETIFQKYLSDILFEGFHLVVIILLLFIFHLKLAYFYYLIQITYVILD